MDFHLPKRMRVGRHQVYRRHAKPAEEEVVDISKEVKMSDITVYVGVRTDAAGNTVFSTILSEGDALVQSMLRQQSSTTGATVVALPIIPSAAPPAPPPADPAPAPPQPPAQAPPTPPPAPPPPAAPPAAPAPPPPPAAASAPAPTNGPGMGAQPASASPPEADRLGPPNNTPNPVIPNTSPSPTPSPADPAAQTSAPAPPPDSTSTALPIVPITNTALSDATSTGTTFSGTSTTAASSSGTLEQVDVAKTPQSSGDGHPSTPVIAGTVVASVGGLTILLLISLMLLRYYRHRRRAIKYDGSSPLHSAANLHGGNDGGGGGSGGGGFRGGFGLSAGTAFRGGISAPLTGPDAARVAPGSAMELSPPEGALGGRGVIPSTAFFRADRGAAARSPNRSSSPTLGADSPSPLGGVRSPPGRSKLGAVAVNPFGDDEIVPHDEGGMAGFAFSDDHGYRGAQQQQQHHGGGHEGQPDLQRQTTDGISLTSIYRDSWPAPDPPPHDAMPAPLGIHFGPPNGSSSGPPPRQPAPSPPPDVWPGPLAPRVQQQQHQQQRAVGGEQAEDGPRPYHAAYAAPFGSSPSPSPTDPADVWPGPNAPARGQQQQQQHPRLVPGPTSGGGGGGAQRGVDDEEEEARRRETLRPSPARTPQIHEGAEGTYPFPERASPMLGWSGPGVGGRRLRPGEERDGAGGGGYGRGI